MAPCTPHPLDPLLINAHLMSVDLGLAQMHVTYFIIMFLHLSVILFTTGGGGEGGGLYPGKFLSGGGVLSQVVSVQGGLCLGGKGLCPGGLFLGEGSLSRWSLSRGRGLCPDGLFLGGGVSVQWGRGASVQVVSF